MDRAQTHKNGGGGRARSRGGGGGGGRSQLRLNSVLTQVANGHFLAGWGKASNVADTLFLSVGAFGAKAVL